jgi:hypothetical protein
MPIHRVAHKSVDNRVKGFDPGFDGARCDSPSALHFCGVAALWCGCESRSPAGEPSGGSIKSRQGGEIACVHRRSLDDGISADRGVTAMKTKLALLLIALPLVMSALAGCTVVVDDRPHPYHYYWR